MAKKTEELSKEEKISEGISSFVSEHRSTIIVLLVAIVVILAAIGIISAAVNTKNEKAQIRVEELAERYSSYSISLDTAEYESLVADLSKEVKGSSFAAARASYILGLTYYVNKSYADAYEAFNKCYELSKKIYLAPLALINAAASKDSLGESDAAVELYTKAVEEYPEAGTTPKALFNIARIYISSDKTELAKANLTQIVDEYPASEYGRLAKNLLILM